MAKNKNHMANLTPWKPGQSGNPTGPKPGYKHVKTIVRNALEAKAPDEYIKALKDKGITPAGKSWDAVLVAIAIGKAASGSIQHLKELWDRRDGKAKEYHEHSGAIEHVTFQFQKKPRQK